MSERFCDVGRGVTLCYETFGEPEDPPVLLIMGLATQMIAWHEDFCDQLAARGLYVIRFDNRDIGHSTHFDFRAPSLRHFATRRFAPEQYDIGDMAEDARGLLRELDLAAAHVVGVSMGGMIAQTLAARRPEDVRSLVSMSSTTGSRFHGQPHPTVYRELLRGRPSEPEEFIAAMVDLFTRVGTPPPHQDIEQIRELIAKSLERDRHPWGRQRQLGAILASGNRTRELHEIKAPTLVIHGDRDKLIAPSGGRGTARAIPGARLLIAEGLGHDLARPYWPLLLDAITDHFRAADAERPAKRAPELTET
jgi:pimeloyl-ACP methyl ester carboxylesterase